MITLWPQQAIGITELKNTFRAGHKRSLYTGPPGCGKTNMAAYMVSEAAGKDFDALFICNRVELIEQTARAFGALNIDFGIIGGGFSFDPHARINIGSIDTLKRNIRLRRAPRLIIWDECRGLGATGWTKVFNAFPDAYHVGLDATPIRTDGKSLGEYFTAMVCGPTYSELRRLGRLVPFKVFAPHIPDMTGVKTVRGDYEHGATELLMDKPLLVGDVVGFYKTHAGSRQGLAFGCSRIHSEHLAAQFRDAGISARHLDGDTDKLTRKNIVAAFRRKDIQVLTNCQLFTAGFDVPGIEVIVDASPTQSIAVAVQRWGRGSRAENGKEYCRLHDHAGNVFRHNVPDADRVWTLDAAGEKRNKRDSKSISVRQCPSCYCCNPAGSTHCRECGAAFPIQPREVEQRDGELVQLDGVRLDLERAAKRREVAMAKDLAALERIERERGYRRGWARFVYQARRRA